MAEPVREDMRLTVPVTITVITCCQRLRFSHFPKFGSCAGNRQCQCVRLFLRNTLAISSRPRCIDDARADGRTSAFADFILSLADGKFAEIGFSGILIM